MMKKLGIISIFLCFIFQSSSIFAQNEGTISSFNMWFGAGYAGIMHPSVDNIYAFKGMYIDGGKTGIKAVGGYGGIVGLGYGVEHKHFLFSLGAEFDFKKSTSKFDDFDMQVGEIIDINTGKVLAIGTTITSDIMPFVLGGFKDNDGIGDQFAMQYKFSKFKDVYSIGYINIPLLFGGKFGTFYFMVGGKFGINMFANAKTSSNHSSGGFYPQFMDAFVNMDDHSFKSDVKTESRNIGLGFSFNVAASAEIGADFKIGKTTQLRLALFADYGVLNINRINNIYKDNTTTAGNFFYIPASNPQDPIDLDPNRISHNSFLSSIESNQGESPLNPKYSVNPLLVGIKLTFVFPFKSKPTCPAVQSRNYPETNRWKTGRHQNY
jgi:hypothetical protein